MYCDKCGTDVMETGFRVAGRWTKLYMRFHGQGVITIATSEDEATVAECGVCGAQMPMSPVQMMRVA